MEEVEVESNSKTKNRRNTQMKHGNKIFIIFVLTTVIIATFLSIWLCLKWNKETVFEAPGTQPTPTEGPFDGDIPEAQKVWYEKALKELNDALEMRQNTNRAKNVIIFVGDGMGPATVTGSRIWRYGEEGLFSWEQFPAMGTLKTYCADKQVPDSMASATALFCGVKANYETGGVASSVKVNDCSASLDPDNHADSILKWAQDADMSTGFVTNTRVVHATPAVLYAHVPDRRWECEHGLTPDQIKMGCRDIARQLVETDPGRRINVIMGGGRQCLVSNSPTSPSDPQDTYSCYSTDGRDLIKDWEHHKNDNGFKNVVVQNTGELRNVKTADVDYLLGIFANGHLIYDDIRDKTPLGMPSLSEMTSTAVKTLSKNKNGFVLVVESGLIDQAHHRGWAKRAFSEVHAMDDAIKDTIELLKDKLNETLIIVTSDHSHTLTINGYPDRGTSIFGVAQNSKFDGIPYTTLTYGTGHFGFQMEMNADGTIQRRNPRDDDFEDYEYNHQVAVKSDEETHGGNDVAIHATGPWSHLFHNVHEQSYVAHVIAYAAKIGKFKKILNEK